MSMRKTTFAPGQLLHSVHMEKSYLGKTGYPVLYTYRSCLGRATRNSYEQLQASDHAPRQSWHRGQWAVPGSCEQALSPSINFLEIASGDISKLLPNWSPCIMCVQYIGGCSVHRGVLSTSGEYHEYIGGISWVHRGDIMSTSGDVQYIGGISWWMWGDSMSTAGNVQYIGRIPWVHRW